MPCSAGAHVLGTAMAARDQLRAVPGWRGKCSGLSMSALLLMDTFVRAYFHISLIKIITCRKKRKVTFHYVVVVDTVLPVRLMVAFPEQLSLHSDGLERYAVPVGVFGVEITHLRELLNTQIS